MIRHEIRRWQENGRFYAKCLGIGCDWKYDHSHYPALQIESTLHLRHGGRAA